MGIDERLALVLSGRQATSQAQALAARILAAARELRDIEKEAAAEEAHGDAMDKLTGALGAVTTLGSIFAPGAIATSSVIFTAVLGVSVFTRWAARIRFRRLRAALVARIEGELERLIDQWFVNALQPPPGTEARKLPEGER